MAKKGGSKHLVRLTVPRYVRIVDKKSTRWLLSGSAGKHKKFESMSLAVFLRDVLGIAQNRAEVKAILNAKNVLIDGKVVKDEKQPVGLMDVISIPKSGKSYLIGIGKGRLVSNETKVADKKLCRVIGKRTVSGGKIAITFHDGRNIIADNHIKVGDTAVIKLPEGKIAEVLKLEKGSRCVVMRGLHAGKIAELAQIIERKGSMDPEATLKGADGEFTTLLKYLFVVGKHF